MKLTNLKKLASSALAILLCASMILSFSLSVYAMDMDSIFMATGEDVIYCSGWGTLEMDNYQSFTAWTDVVVGVEYLYYVDVVLGVYDGTDPGGILGWDEAYPDEMGITSDHVEVTVECENYADMGSAGHTIEDKYGFSCTEGTFIEVEY